MALVCSGCIILLFTGTLAAPLLGLAAVLWYNGFYTRFKTSNAFAAIPGALIGAIPPAIGWTAGGGSLSDPRLAALCLFFFMWQVPHFFLHLLVFGKEYEKIGLPSLTAVFTEPQLGRLTFQWFFSAAVSLQLVIFYGLLQSLFVQISLLTVSLWLVVKGINLMREHKPSYRNVFEKINYFILTVMLLIFLDKLPPLL
jgi:protoheme IX farnesyltransferase